MYVFLVCACVCVCVCVSVFGVHLHVEMDGCVTMYVCTVLLRLCSNHT